MESYLMLCKKKVKNGNQSFEVTFGYRQNKKEDGTFEDVKTVIFNADGTTKDVAKSIKVALADSLRKELDADNHYPYRLVLDDELKLDNGDDSYYVTINKDKEGKLRLDKQGHKHAIIVIRKVKSYEPVPLKSLTLDDIDNIE